MYYDICMTYWYIRKITKYLRIAQKWKDSVRLAALFKY